MGLVAKAFQDIITFSRNSNGTYVNSNGYITNSAVSNYLGYSNQPENALWTKSNSFVQQNLAINSQDFDLWSLGAGVTVAANSTIAPDGTLTADRITFTAGGAAEFVRRTATLTVGVIYTVSVYAQAAVGTPTFVFDVGNTTVSTAQTPTTSWQRFTFTFTFSGANQWVDLEASAAGAIAFWGAQIVQGSVPGDYRATTSAALPCLYADYNGALRARKLCENTATSSHSISESVVVTAGIVYTASVKIKAAERGFAQLRYENGGSTEFFAVNVNLSTGAYTTATFGTPTSTSATVTPDDDGYWKVTVSAAANNTTFVTAVFVQSVLGTNSYTGDGSSGIYIADAQLNDGSAATAYWDNATGSATYAPRFDYNPATLAAEGFVVEEQRANLLLQSNDFQTSWTQVNITRTLNSILSPSGNVDGVKIAATATAATVETQGATVAATSATGSAYVKQGTSATTANFFTLRNQTTLTDLISGTLNYSTGVFTYITGSTGVVVTNANNGWWRIALSATTGITSGDTVRLYVGFAGGAATAGDFLYAYGAQLEAGAGATSYIPTAASQVIRAADLASINTLSPWYNSAAGTWFAEFKTSYSGLADSSRWVVGADQSANKRMLYVSSATDVIATYDGASTLAPTGDVTGAIAKAAMNYTATTRAIVANGGTVASGALAAGFAASSAVNLGLGSFAGSQLNGWIRRVTFYPRVLTNAELQTLTTL